jgi:hypothetical protein
MSSSEYPPPTYQQATTSSARPSSLVRSALGTGPPSSTASNCPSQQTSVASAAGTETAVSAWNSLRDAAITFRRRLFGSRDGTPVFPGRTTGYAIQPAAQNDRETCSGVKGVFKALSLTGWNWDQAVVGCKVVCPERDHSQLV